MNLIVLCDELACFMKSSSSFCPFVQMKNMSSMYRFQVKMCFLYFAVSFCSIVAMKMLAYEGATFVPIAVPRICR